MGLEDPILIPPQDTPTPTRYLGEDDVALEVIPESEPQRQDGPIATPFPALQSGSDQSPFPLGLLVLLTIGCGSLSLVITWILRSSSAATLAQPPRPLAPPKRLILPPTTAPRVQPMAARGQQVTMAPATSFAQKQPISPQIRPSFPTAGQPRVTILAPEELTPLDEMPLPPDDSLNLADQLDIRRHYSLSSLIRDSEQ
ncbi:MAG: hypothetical protein EA366_11170 [Spirulina sp. DLM2.Bin59]|nr:MAG: hypothetical protein EA366_11170 [Spirulina sp. DLM2.Bin59]